MKRHLLQPVVPAVLWAALLTFTSCSSAPKVEKNTAVAYQEGVPGGTLVERYTITATVAALDLSRRNVTLVAPDGSRNTFVADPDFRNFDQLRVGDPVQAKVTRELVVFLRKDRTPPNAEQSAATAPALERDKPGVLRADTLQRSAKVGTIDTKRREAVLHFADGTSKTFPVRKDVDLRQVAPGDEVVIRTTSAVVLTPGKP